MVAARRLWGRERNGGVKCGEGFAQGVKLRSRRKRDLQAERNCKQEDDVGGRAVALWMPQRIAGAGAEEDGWCGWWDKVEEPWVPVHAVLVLNAFILGGGGGRKGAG